MPGATYSRRAPPATIGADVSRPLAKLGVVVIILTMLTHDTLIATLGPETDDVVEVDGERWNFVVFGEEITVSSTTGSHVAVLDAVQLQDGEVATVADAVDAARQEAVAWPTVAGVARVILGGAILHAPTTTVGGYLFGDGEQGFACLAWPHGMVEKAVEVVDEPDPLDPMESMEVEREDRTAFGAARAFVSRSSVRGARRAS